MEGNMNATYAKFMQWLTDNGAIFDKVIFLTHLFRLNFHVSLQGVSEGSGRRKTLANTRYLLFLKFQAFMFIPNSCIISVTRVRECPELKEILASNEDTFKNHPDSDQLSLTLYLMMESLKS